MSRWPRIRLGSYFRIKHGYAFKGAHFVKSGQHVVLTPGNFCEDGGLKSQGEKEKFYGIKPPPAYVLSKGQLLVVMTDLTQEARILGSPAFIPESSRFLHNQRLGLIEELSPNLDLRYLYYLFNWQTVREQIKATATGATVKHTAPDRIYAVEAPLPPLAIQRRIASILSAYDDLIENNTRRVAILEEMARHLYEEWFVHFRFPGHENARFKDSERGRIPDGWGISTVEYAYEELFDGPHATPKTSDTGPIFLGIRNIKESGGLDLTAVKRISNEEFPRWTKRVLPREGDIVFSYEATLNRYALIPRGFKGCLGRRIALIRPLNAYRHFLYLHFFSDDWRTVVRQNILSGSTVDRIPLTNFPKFPVLLPPAQVAQCFEEIASQHFRLVQVLSEKVSNLREQRDLLLPKLVSGELDVSGLPLPAAKDAAAA